MAPAHRCVRQPTGPAQLNSKVALNSLATAREALEERIAWAPIDVGPRRERHFRVAHPLSPELGTELVGHELVVGGLDQTRAQQRVHLDEVREVTEPKPLAQSDQVVNRQRHAVAAG